MAWRSTPLPKDWPRIRARIRERDPYCVECLKHGRRTPTTDVHHLGDRDDHRDEMLEGVCDWHHKRLTSAQANAARKPVRQRRDAEKHPGLR